ncbi:MAG: divalent-cation tolerance protein CutA [Planctomycetes bacterium]|nr:divalent-cation tolerance protein CutA [Planctomycetota bacterium]
MAESASREPCVVVLITAPDAACAEILATALVSERLAACVGRLGPLESRFRWNGAIDSTSEILLLAKTTAARFEALCARVRALHPYELPEIVALPIVAGFDRYLDWVARECGT